MNLRRFRSNGKVTVDERAQIGLKWQPFPFKNGRCTQNQKLRACLTWVPRLVNVEKVHDVAQRKKRPVGVQVTLDTSRQQTALPTDNPSLPANDYHFKCGKIHSEEPPTDW